MKPERINLENEYIIDMITNNGFDLKNDDKFGPVNVDSLINSSKFMDCEYRCDCGSFIGADIIGQVCPKCGHEISLHSLNFEYTGWLDLGEHCVISHPWYIMLKRVLGTNTLRFILGDYKSDNSVQYNENDINFEENRKNKKSGRKSNDDISVIIKKIPKSKHQFQGIGHDEFRRRFEEVMLACAPKSSDELETLLANKDSIFTSKIPIYSTAFRPVNKTSETLFYPKINKPFAKMASIVQTLPDMILDIEKIHALNYIQNDLIEACEYEIKSEMGKKDGFIRSEINGGTFSFSGRAVITLDISLCADEVDLPYSMVVTVYQYILTHRYAVRNHTTLEQAYLFVSTYEENEAVMALLDEIITEGAWIYILREPTNNLASINLCRIRRYKLHDDTISLPVEPLDGYNADFDGDALDVCFIPKEIKHIFEAYHFSCMSNYITNETRVSLKEWCAISLGRMSE